MLVKKTHPMDGTKLAGKPIGKTLSVLQIVDHLPAEGPSRSCCIAMLSDGTWEFLWNLTVVERAKKCSS